MGQKSVNLKNLAKENSDLTEHIFKTEEKNNENNSKSKRNVQKKKYHVKIKLKLENFLIFLNLKKEVPKTLLLDTIVICCNFFCLLKKIFLKLKKRIFLNI
ncbi:hypothetical protein GCWU000323_01543 [Leptotrichia hofstadii F0254]|uniref:Uncharacterized protein n=1 Tax=Leptotrichia hofstadii F0254 TaxID=634994 RepID=C9MYB6_9FUSO|nr:hypothetical protein GCWU000323_01543 [Leptotrichia hofstadii F0254]